MSMSAETQAAERPVWRPSRERITHSQLMAFLARANQRHGLKLESYRDLHAWSLAQRPEFWDLVWDSAI